MPTINFTMGDTSRDGHGMTTTITLESNLTAKEIGQAYCTSIEKYPVLALFDSVAEEYEDNLIPTELIQELFKLGFVDANPSYEDFLEMDRVDDHQMFLDIYLFIAKLGNPDLVVGEPVDFEEMDIGGYGLFFN